MRLYDVTVSLGGYYTIRSQVYGENQQQASNNMINSLCNNYPSMQLTVIKIKEVKKNADAQADDYGTAAEG